MKALVIDELSNGVNVYDKTPLINLPRDPDKMPPDFAMDYQGKFGHPPVYHKGPDGVTARVGRAFTESGLNQNNSEFVSDISKKKDLLMRFKQIYASEEPYSHLKAWPIARDWLRKNLPDDDQIRIFLDNDCMEP